MCFSPLTFLFDNHELESTKAPFLVSSSSALNIQIICWVFSYARSHFSVFQCSLQFMWPMSSDRMFCTTTSEAHRASGKEKAPVSLGDGYLSVCWWSLPCGLDLYGDFLRVFTRGQVGIGLLYCALLSGISRGMVGGERQQQHLS